jgi:translation initiation factor IF-1
LIRATTRDAIAGCGLARLPITSNQEHSLGKKRKRKGGKRKRRFEREENNQRSDHVEVEGTVVNVFAGGNFEVELDDGPVVKAEVSGRMRRYRIRVLLGDRVRVALSPYDLSHGLISYRFKEPRRVA